ncbi:MAG: FG-GAP repeat domain-containing protein, partial [Myxococcales bacterium]
YQTGASPSSVVIADLNGDAKLDLTVANSAADSISVFLGRGEGTFAPRLEYPTLGATAFAVVTDFDHDGRPDVGVAHPDANRFTILPNQCL